MIWSTPLYCFGFPSHCKAVIDRMLPLGTRAQVVDENCVTQHPPKEERSTRMMLIAGAGFPDVEGNFDGMVFEFRRMFGDIEPMILCPEAPMMHVDEAKPATEPYLALVRQAGREYAESGRFSEETQQALHRPMIEPDLYRRLCSENA